MMSYDAVGVGTEEWYDTQPPRDYVWHDKQSWSTELNTTTLLYRNKQVTCDVKRVHLVWYGVGTGRN